MFHPALVAPTGVPGARGAPVLLLVDPSVSEIETGFVTPLVSARETERKRGNALFHPALFREIGVRGDHGAPVHLHVAHSAKEIGIDSAAFLVPAQVTELKQDNVLFSPVKGIGVRGDHGAPAPQLVILDKEQEPEHALFQVLAKALLQQLLIAMFHLVNEQFGGNGGHGASAVHHAAHFLSVVELDAVASQDNALEIKVKPDNVQCLPALFKVIGVNGANGVNVIRHVILVNGHELALAQFLARVRVKEIKMKIVKFHSAHL